MTVEWKPVALDQLADIYTRLLDVADQREPARQVIGINARLAADPWFLGESRGNPDYRVWCTGWLSVTFWLNPAGGVRVLRVSPLPHGAAGEDSDDGS